MSCRYDNTSYFHQNTSHVQHYERTFLDVNIEETCGASYQDISSSYNNRKNCSYDGFPQNDNIPCDDQMPQDQWSAEMNNC